MSDQPQTESLARLVRAEWRWGLLVFALALVLRLAYLGFMMDSPLFDMPTMDAGVHDSWALQLSGEERGPMPWDGEPYFRAPLYPYFLGLLYKLPGSPYLLVRLVQFLMGALSCALLFLIGRRLYDRRTGLIAGIMAAFYWIFIYFEGELLLPVLIVFLNLLAVLALVEALRSPRPWLFLLSGLFFGLSAITRPNVLLVLPFAAGWAWWLLRRENPRRALLAAGAMLLGAALCILPVTVRNAVVGGDRVLIASQAGVNFYMGNNELSDGRTAWIPGTRATWWGGYEDAIRIAEEDEGRELRPSEVSSYWMGRGTRFLREQPGKAAELYLLKARALLDFVEQSNNQNIYFFRNYNGFISWPVFLGIALLLPLGLAGIILNRRDRHWALIGGFFLIYLASFLPFFISARYRVPAVPFLMLLAAVFLADRVKDWREKRWNRFGAGLAVAVVLFGLLAASSSDRPEAELDGPSTGHLALGNAWFNQGDMGKAAEHLALLVNYREPYRSRAIMLLGKVAVRENRPEKAAEFFGRAVELNPRLAPEVDQFLAATGAGSVAALMGGSDDPDASVEAWKQIADRLVREQNYAEAGPYYQRILEADPSHLGAHINLGNIMLLNPAMREDAVALFQDGLEHHPGNESLLANLAGAYLNLDRLDEAEALLRDSLLTRNPESGQYRQMMGYIQARRSGRTGP